ncbi:MAG TPA: thiamine pyrophosphate-dependent enzyme [Methylomirabilota bacterium]|nr:thiamine pyrophosphate-dependent enzyme [Methylomirabilota bacterium]
MIAGKDLAGLLEAQGCDFFTGVPCSLIEGVIGALETHPRLPYVPAVREDVAVGLAAGAWLAGRTPVVLMQNSGLGTSLNALVSLSLMYRLPALLLVTWRGYQGKDAPEHVLMGEISPSLLGLIGIPHRILGPATVAEDIGWARAESERLCQPVALLLPPGVVDTEPAGPPPASHAAPPARTAVAPATGEAGRAPEISRLEALRAARAPLTDEPVVHANGYLCRESFAVEDRRENFYMIGSMGLASAIALGLALVRPNRRTVVFDGDGNLLMSLGILAMIGGGPVMGRGRPRNLVHVVFDNGVYGSTGNQLSPSRWIALDRVARAAGYETAVAATAAVDITRAVAAALARPGPHFVLARVTTEEHPVPRIPYAPEEIRDRFRAALAGAR